MVEMTEPAKRLYEKLTVTWIDKTGHLTTEYATGFYRTNRSYEERRERGWLTLSERLKQKGMEE